ncbi:hypothetical protein HJD18_00565 [Thermoleophilia bacterium SCSIO 60948]|nr:hypothetical protein HJD18_00565 [Thermoleophilia bacterium SCSIO 60948]
MARSLIAFATTLMTLVGVLALPAQGIGATPDFDLLSGASVEARDFDVRSPMTSADARTTFFTTEQRLVARDRDRSDDLYVTRESRTRLVTIGSSAARSGGRVGLEAVSPDGRRAFFTSAARFVRADRDSRPDLYVSEGRDLRLVSTGSQDPPGEGPSYAYSPVTYSPGVRSVAFETNEPLSSEDRDKDSDVYVWAGGKARLASGAFRPSGCGGCFIVGGVSDDGASVVFSTAELSDRSDLDDWDAWRWTDGELELLADAPFASRDLNPPTSVSDGLSTVVFVTTDPLLAEDRDENDDVYVSRGGELDAVSISALADGEAEGDSSLSTEISADGRQFLFTTPDRLTAADDDDELDTYRWRDGEIDFFFDGAIQMPPDARSIPPQLSDDGSRVVFSSVERLSGDDADRGLDVYEATQGEAATLISDQQGAPGRLPVYLRAISDDFETVFVHTKGSLSPNDADPSQDVYRWSGGEFEGVSVRSADASRGSSELIGASPDGSSAVILTGESLSREDRDGGLEDVYLAELGR